MRIGGIAFILAVVVLIFFFFENDKTATAPIGEPSSNSQQDQIMKNLKIN